MAINDSIAFYQKTQEGAERCIVSPHVTSGQPAGEAGGPLALHKPLALFFSIPGVDERIPRGYGRVACVSRLRIARSGSGSGDARGEYKLYM